MEGLALAQADISCGEGSHSESSSMGLLLGG